MLSCWLYCCLLEDDLTPPPPRGTNPRPQNTWIREENLNWLYLRDLPYPTYITAPEAKLMVSRFLEMRTAPKVVNTLRVAITTDKNSETCGTHVQHVSRLFLCRH